MGLKCRTLRLYLTLIVAARWLLVVFRIYVALAVFQPYRDLEAGDNQSLKFKRRDLESNSGPLAPQAKSLTTQPPPLLLLPEVTMFHKHIFGLNKAIVHIIKSDLANF